MPKYVRNSSAASRSGDRSRPYARSFTLIRAMLVPPGFTTALRRRGDQDTPPGYAFARAIPPAPRPPRRGPPRSEEHTSELQSHSDLVCRLLLEKKKKNKIVPDPQPATS